MATRSKTLTSRAPSYLRHAPSGQAYVRINRAFHYLGLYGSVESKAKYKRLVAEWSSNPSSFNVRVIPSDLGTGLTVNELALAYLNHCEAYYRNRSGQPTGEADNVRYALKPLKELYGFTAAGSFGPRALKAI